MDNYIFLITIEKIYPRRSFKKQNFLKANKLISKRDK